MSELASPGADSLNSAPRLVGLQAVRGLAAALVVFVHYNGTAVGHGFAITGLEHAAVSGIGVDIFFVISGFIMELTAGGQSRLGEGRAAFLSRRAMRVLPLYWFLTIVAYAATVAFGDAIHTTVSLRQLLLSLLLLPSTRPDGQAFYVISVAWTLTIEVYFYILFALLIHLRPTWRVVALSSIFAASVLLGAWARPQSPLARYLVDPMLFEFVAGCLLAMVLRRGVRLSPMSASIMAAVAVSGMLFAFELVVPGAWRVVVWGVPAWLLVTAVVLSTGPSWTRVEAPFTYLGDMSYSLYLSHFFAVAMFVRLHLRWSGSLLSSSWVCATVFCVLCLCLAHACYVAVERPARRWMLHVRARQVAFAMRAEISPSG